MGLAVSLPRCSWVSKLLIWTVSFYSTLGSTSLISGYLTPLFLREFPKYFHFFCTGRTGPKSLIAAWSCCWRMSYSCDNLQQGWLRNLMRAKHTEQNTSTALRGTSRVGTAAEFHGVALVKGFWCFEGIERKLPPAECPLYLQIHSAVASARQTTCKSFRGIFGSLHSRRHGPNAGDQAEKDGCNVKIMSTLFQPNDDCLERKTHGFSQKQFGTTVQENHFET